MSQNISQKVKYITSLTHISREFIKLYMYFLLFCTSSFNTRFVCLLGSNPKVLKVTPLQALHNSFIWRRQVQEFVQILMSSITWILCGNSLVFEEKRVRTSKTHKKWILRGKCKSLYRLR